MSRPIPCTENTLLCPHHLASSHTSFGTQISIHLLQEALPDSHPGLGDILVPSTLPFWITVYCLLTCRPLWGSRSVAGRDCVSFVLYSLPSAHYSSDHLITMKYY